VVGLKVKNYQKPATLDEVLEQLAVPGKTKLLAGGTDLIIEIHGRHIEVDTLIDLSNIRELTGISYEDGTLSIGSMTTFAELMTDETIRTVFPALAEAAATVGAPQIRSRATIGGNTANAATAADGVAPLLAAEAVCHVVSKRGKREVAMEELLVDINKTSLAQDEIITHFTVRLPEGTKQAFEKIGRRQALAIARINLAVLLNFDGDKVSKARVAAGAVGRTCYRIKEVEDFLVGKSLSDETIREASDLIDDRVAFTLKTRKTTPYKRRIAAAVLERALRRLKGDQA
jgi:CO/xanthine dehydrogenase FAD-binding subunit